MEKSEITQTLQKCELFCNLTETQAAVIADMCGILSYETGATIFIQGEYSDKLYLIVGGQVSLHRIVNLGNREATVSIGLLGKGRIMGWSALLGIPSERTATAICQKTTLVIFLEGKALRSFLEKNPETGFKVMERLAHVLGDRLRAAYTAIDAHL